MNAVVLGKKKHCDIKIQFCAKECLGVYMVQERQQNKSSFLVKWYRLM